MSARTMLGAAMISLLAACGGSNANDDLLTEASPSVDAGRRRDVDASVDAGANAAGANAGGTDARDAGSVAGAAFVKPAGTIAVSFTFDDRANRVFYVGALRYSGSFIFDATTRKATHDPAWSGPHPVLDDDGPWKEGHDGGHEPVGSVAGDHKWGVTVFVTPPAAGFDVYAYSLVDAAYEAEYGAGWIGLPGASGTFVVGTGATEPIALGLASPALGTKDLRIVIDTRALDSGSGVTWDTKTVGIKLSSWGWSELPLAQDAGVAAGGGLHTLQLSKHVGSGKRFSRSGLLRAGDTPQFVVVLGGTEYRLANGNAATAGITASVANGAEAFTPTPIQTDPISRNTFIVAP